MSSSFPTLTPRPACLTRIICLATTMAASLSPFLPLRAAEAPAPAANRYQSKILVANRPGLAEGALIDPHLINPWGVALRPPGAGGHIWISNAGNASTSTYVGDAHGSPLHQDGLKIVYLDGPLVSYEDGIANVTGQVYNIASDFPGQPVEFPVRGPAANLSGPNPVDLGVISGSAKFVFVTTDGTINAWRSGTAPSMNTAVIVKDYSERGADRIKSLRYLPAFTGVAMSAKSKGGNRLYVTDFQNNVIRVLDNTWADITAQVPFERPKNLPSDHSPFNIQLLGERLYVAYAALDLDAEEPATDVPAPGAGRIVAYDLDGHVVQQFADDGKLNSPWGVAIAPENFGPFGGALLVANFGDGTIAGFNLKSGQFIDYLRDPAGAPVAIDGIWGLTFGNGVSLGDADSLYFTAGPNEEQDGLFGRLRLLTNDTPVAAGTSDVMPSSPRSFLALVRHDRTLTASDNTRYHAEVAAWLREQETAGRKIDFRTLAPEVVRFGAAETLQYEAAPITATIALDAPDLATAAAWLRTLSSSAYGASVEIRPALAPAKTAMAAK